MSGRIDRGEVERIARLARLRLAEDEAERLTRDLDAILGYVQQLAELDRELDGVPPTAYAHAAASPLREDEPSPCLAREEALAAAPDTEDGHFRVPPILDEGRGDEPR